MFTLADSHIHLFEGGFRKSGVDEVAEYERLIKEYSIEAALVVGYEGEEWATGNNSFIAGLAESRPWIRPVAYLSPTELSVEHLETISAKNFIGISLYLLSTDDMAAIEGVSDEVWAWIVRRGWLISVNSKGELWRVWHGVLTRNPELRLCMSHLGLPEVDKEEPSDKMIAKELANQRLLHTFANVYLKFSGFYALEEVAPFFPYTKSYPYVRYILENFDNRRLIWGSDFTPALLRVSFEETFAHLQRWLSSHELLERILRKNLIEFLD